MKSIRQKTKAIRRRSGRLIHRKGELCEVEGQRYVFKAVLSGPDGNSVNRYGYFIHAYLAAWNRSLFCIHS